MNLSIQLVCYMIGIVVIMLLSQRFYRWHLHLYSMRKLKQLNFDLEEITYSLEEIIYFVTLPSIDKLITDANPEQLIVRPDFNSIFFPQLVGVSVMIEHTGEGNRVIAYLPLERLGTPMLDTLLLIKKIDLTDYERMSAYRLLHHSTIREIQLEVHRQLQTKPRFA